jgi:hypothetical protein
MQLERKVIDTQLLGVQNGRGSEVEAERFADIGLGRSGSGRGG